MSRALHRHPLVRELMMAQREAEADSAAYSHLRAREMVRGEWFDRRYHGTLWNPARYEGPMRTRTYETKARAKSGAERLARFLKLDGWRIVVCSSVRNT